MAATLKTASVAFSVTILRAAARNCCHPRLYGCFSFAVLLGFIGSIIGAVYMNHYTAATQPSSSQIGLQLRNMLEGYWNYGDSKFAQSWKDIASISDFYSWMKGPLRDFLFAGDANAGCGERARLSLTMSPTPPSLTSHPNPNPNHNPNLTS